MLRSVGFGLLVSVYSIKMACVWGEGWGLTQNKLHCNEERRMPVRLFLDNNATMVLCGTEAVRKINPLPYPLIVLSLLHLHCATDSRHEQSWALLLLKITLSSSNKHLSEPLTQICHDSIIKHFSAAITHTSISPSACIDFRQNAESISSSSVAQHHPSERRERPSGNRK